MPDDADQRPEPDAAAPPPTGGARPEPQRLHRDRAGRYRADGLVGPTRRYVVVVAMLVTLASLPTLAAITAGSRTMEETTDGALTVPFLPPSSGGPVIVPRPAGSAVYPPPPVRASEPAATATVTAGDRPDGQRSADPPADRVDPGPAAGGPVAPAEPVRPPGGPGGEPGGDPGSAPAPGAEADGGWEPDLDPDAEAGTRPGASKPNGGKPSAGKPSGSKPSGSKPSGSKPDRGAGSGGAKPGRQPDPPVRRTPWKPPLGRSASPSVPGDPAQVRPRCRHAPQPCTARRWKVKLRSGRTGHRASGAFAAAPCHRFVLKVPRQTRGQRGDRAGKRVTTRRLADAG